MRRFLACLLFLVFTIPASSSAVGGNEAPQHWVCSQVGTLERGLAYVVSPVFIGKPNNYEDKEVAFEGAAAEQTSDKFIPEFEARCYDFRSVERANKFLKRKLKQAEKRNFQILWIKFATNR